MSFNLTLKQPNLNPIKNNTNPIKSKELDPIQFPFMLKILFLPAMSTIKMHSFWESEASLVKNFKDM
jgi:hypothetical protein